MGRPRGCRNFSTIVNEALGAEVAAKIGGRTRKMSKLELGLHQLATKAGQGDLKAMDKAIALQERHGPTEEMRDIPEEETAYDLKTLASYLSMCGMLDDA